MKRRFENLTKKAGRAVRHWWLMMLAGVLCIAAGIAVFAFPLESYVTLSLLFGVLLLVVGVAKLIAASTSGNYFMMRGYVIVGGVLDLILGLFLCFSPGVTLMLLPIMMGFWMMYNSFILIGFSGDFETFGVPGSGWLVAGGILLLILSIMVLVNPLGAGIATVVVLAGVGLIVLGILLCVLSMKLKDIHRNFDAEYVR
ncbi:MAG: DUF308 domain-containing protein [Bacteroidales bacterium]|nr:DUF308 domain-containing protein [Bacteroidales bacterium]